MEKGDDDIVGVDMHNGTVNVDEPKQKVDLTKFTDRHKFVFDDSLLTLLSTSTFEHLGLFVSCFEIYGNKVPPCCSHHGRPV